MIGDLSFATDAHDCGIRVFVHEGHAWRVWDVDGQFGFEVANLPLVWIDAPRPLEEMSDVELLELVRAELETRDVRN